MARTPAASTYVNNLPLHRLECLDALWLTRFPVQGCAGQLHL
jgi:hypothetical protein